jgi:hypothetical protein
MYQVWLVLAWMSSYLVPDSLPIDAGEGLEAGAGALVVHQVNVALELEHTTRCRTDHLLVVQDIPHTRGAILRVSGASRVDKALLRSGVGTDKGDETLWRNGLVGEQLEAVGGSDIVGREQPIGAGLGAVGPSDKGAHTRAFRADDMGDVGAELDEIGVRDAVCLVHAVPLFHLLHDLLQPVVCGTLHLLGSQDDGSVGTAGSARVL